MAYQIRRSNRVAEDLELTESDGTVVRTLHIDLDIDAITAQFRAQYNALIKAERAVKAAQKAGVSEENFQSLYMDYGEAIIAVLKTVLGEDNTLEVLEFYEDNYIEMSLQIFPFIQDVIVPKIRDTVAESKQQIRARFRKKGGGVRW